MKSERNEGSMRKESGLKASPEKEMVKETITKNLIQNVPIVQSITPHTMAQPQIMTKPLPMTQPPPATT